VGPVTYSVKVDYRLNNVDRMAGSGRLPGFVRALHAARESE